MGGGRKANACQWGTMKDPKPKRQLSLSSNPGLGTKFCASQRRRARKPKQPSTMARHLVGHLSFIALDVMASTEVVEVFCSYRPVASFRSFFRSFQAIVRRGVRRGSMYKTASARRTLPARQHGAPYLCCALVRLPITVGWWMLSNRGPWCLRTGGFNFDNVNL